MSTTPAETRGDFARRAGIFAALGDGTRLSLIGKLSPGRPQSISRLAQGFSLTRQAVTKHLRVLEAAGLVRSERTGREKQFELRPEPFRELQSYLDRVSSQWEEALNRLQSYVER
jgi:DNA-binding transcriptional ArsR family regulator